MPLNPFIKEQKNSTPRIMLDVLIALLPLIALSIVAYGVKAIWLVSVAVLTALATDFIFSSVLLKSRKSIFDGSSVVTALLITFTVSPLTPYYVLAFGSAAAVLFGKILWGGLGKNRFNPALVGREIMSAIFPSVLGSAGIWATSSSVNVPAQNFFPGLESEYLNSYFSGLIYKTSGAMGEYSTVLIIIGGVYLLMRKRISWHIPFALLTAFITCIWLHPDGDSLWYSTSGLLFGTIFMATDMPSSPNNNYGKLYYGVMIGLVAFILIWGGIRFEYMSFSILILNGFSHKVSSLFSPAPWGTQHNWLIKTEEIILLTLAILGVTFAVLSIHTYHFGVYLIYVYLIYMIYKFSICYKHEVAHYL